MCTSSADSGAGVGVHGAYGCVVGSTHWWKTLFFITILLSMEFTMPLLESDFNTSRKKRTDCPKVRAMRNFDLEAMMGYWYVLQYYASTEELPEYACMRSHFGLSPQDQHITSNFSYIYAEDPLREKIQGNITWMIPNFSITSHWVHTEDIYEGIYNTFILDIEYNAWALIMHCAEKKKHPRYLSALLLSRTPELGDNVINYLREKLPRYNIDISFMFPINQTEVACNNLMESTNNDPLAYIVNRRKNAKELVKVMLKH